MGSINQLCNKAILLNNGKVLDYDVVSKITPMYFNYGRSNDAKIDLTNVKGAGNGYCKFQYVTLKRNNQDFSNREFSLGDDLNIEFKLNFKDGVPVPIKLSIELKASDGLKIANMIDVDSNFQALNIANDTVIKIKLKDLRLYPDTYYLSLYAGDLSSTEVYNYLEDCISFSVIDGGNLTTRLLPRSAGVLFLSPEWETL